VLLSTMVHSMGVGADPSLLLLFRLPGSPGVRMMGELRRETSTLSFRHAEAETMPQWGVLKQVGHDVKLRAN
jgi:hypothetical protein